MKKFLRFVAFIVVFGLSVPVMAESLSLLSYTSAPELSNATLTVEIYSQTQLYINYVTSSITVEWSSSDENIVTVHDGMISAVGFGNATVTAMINGIPQTCEVTVGAVSSIVTRSAVMAPDSETYVWKTRTGQKYHLIEDCGTTDPSKIVMITLEEAKELGLEPCSKCAAGMH